MCEWQAKIRVARKDELWHRGGAAATEGEEVPTGKEVEEVKELEDSEGGAGVVEWELKFLFLAERGVYPRCFSEVFVNTGLISARMRKNAEE